MPRFFGQLAGVSFQTELLIMNLLGLIFSTLEWGPFKWNEQTEKVWNLPLTDQPITFNQHYTYWIKILSWIVIARIFLAHLYTVTYVANIYSVLTWSRPICLLPWMILSFFKNLIMEIVVFTLCLLLWYEENFSSRLLAEFVIVKLVSLSLAGYSWYNVLCCFMQLRAVERFRKLWKMSQREITEELGAVGKVDESSEDVSSTSLLRRQGYISLSSFDEFLHRPSFEAYDYRRTKSLTTLLTLGTQDSENAEDLGSRVAVDLDLSVVEKCMRALGITRDDVIEIREGVRDRLSFLSSDDVDELLTQTCEHQSLHLPCSLVFNSVSEGCMELAQNDTLEPFSIRGCALATHVTRDLNGAREIANELENDDKDEDEAERSRERRMERRSVINDENDQLVIGITESLLGDVEKRICPATKGEQRELFENNVLTSNERTKMLEERSINGKNEYLLEDVSVSNEERKVEIASSIGKMDETCWTCSRSDKIAGRNANDHEKTKAFTVKSMDKPCSPLVEKNKTSACPFLKPNERCMVDRSSICPLNERMIPDLSKIKKQQNGESVRRHRCYNNDQLDHADASFCRCTSKETLARVKDDSVARNNSNPRNRLVKVTANNALNSHFKGSSENDAPKREKKCVDVSRKQESSTVYSCNFFKVNIDLPVDVCDQIEVSKALDGMINNSESQYSSTAFDIVRGEFRNFSNYLGDGSSLPSEDEVDSAFTEFSAISDFPGNRLNIMKMVDALLFDKNLITPSGTRQVDNRNHFIFMGQMYPKFSNGSAFLTGYNIASHRNQNENRSEAETQMRDSNRDNEKNANEIHADLNLIKNDITDEERSPSSISVSPGESSHIWNGIRRTSRKVQTDVEASFVTRTNTIIDGRSFYIAPANIITHSSAKVDGYSTKPRYHTVKNKTNEWYRTDPIAALASTSEFYSLNANQRNSVPRIGPKVNSNQSLHKAKQSKSNKSRGHPATQASDAPERQHSVPENASRASLCECEDLAKVAPARRGAPTKIPKARIDSTGRKSPRNSEGTELGTWGTMTLAQVAKPSGFEMTPLQAKPPAYPRRGSSESPRSVSGPDNDDLGLSREDKHVERVQRKTNSSAWQPVHGSRSSKAKKPADTDEDNARVLRALVAYNRMTLVEDKREMEARKRKASSGSERVTLSEFSSDERGGTRSWLTAENKIPEADEVRAEHANRRTSEIGLSAEIDRGIARTPENRSVISSAEHSLQDPSAESVVRNEPSRPSTSNDSETAEMSEGRDVSDTANACKNGNDSRAGRDAHRALKAGPTMSVSEDNAACQGTTLASNGASVKNHSFDSKLSSINSRDAATILELLDYHGSHHLKQELRKIRAAGETDARKRYTRYSKSRRVAEDLDVSTTSCAGVEGGRRDRDLERTPGKEDVRRQSAGLAARYSTSSDTSRSTVDPTIRRANIVEQIFADDKRNESVSSRNSVASEETVQTVVRTVNDTLRTPEANYLAEESEIDIFGNSPFNERCTEMNERYAEMDDRRNRGSLTGLKDNVEIVNGSTDGRNVQDVAIQIASSELEREISCVSDREARTNESDSIVNAAVRVIRENRERLTIPQRSVDFREIQDFSHKVSTALRKTVNDNNGILVDSVNIDTLERFTGSTVVTSDSAFQKSNDTRTVDNLNAPRKVFEAEERSDEAGLKGVLSNVSVDAESQMKIDENQYYVLRKNESSSSYRFKITDNIPAVPTNSVNSIPSEEGVVSIFRTEDSSSGYVQGDQETIQKGVNVSREVLAYTDAKDTVEVQQKYDESDCRNKGENKNAPASLEKKADLVEKDREHLHTRESFTKVKRFESRKGLQETSSSSKRSVNDIPTASTDSRSLVASAVGKITSSASKSSNNIPLRDEETGTKRETMDSNELIKHEKEVHDATAVLRKDLPDRGTPSNRKEVASITNSSGIFANSSVIDESVRDSCVDESSTVRISNGHRYDQQRLATGANLLNVREIARNIDWTFRSQGIVLTNRNLKGTDPDDGEIREIQQRHVVDENTVSMVHSALFFKPEIITRVLPRGPLTDSRVDSETAFEEISRELRQRPQPTDFACESTNDFDPYRHDVPLIIDLRDGSIDENETGQENSPSSENLQRAGSGCDLCIVVVQREASEDLSRTSTADDSADILSDRILDTNVELEEGGLNDILDILNDDFFESDCFRDGVALHEKETEARESERNSQVESVTVGRDLTMSDDKRLDNNFDVESGGSGTLNNASDTRRVSGEIGVNLQNESDNFSELVRRMYLNVISYDDDPPLSNLEFPVRVMLTDVTESTEPVNKRSFLYKDVGTKKRADGGLLRNKRGGFSSEQGRMGVIIEEVRDNDGVAVVTGIDEREDTSERESFETRDFCQTLMEHREEERRQLSIVPQLCTSQINSTSSGCTENYNTVRPEIVNRFQIDQLQNSHRDPVTVFKVPNASSREISADRLETRSISTSNEVVRRERIDVNIERLEREKQLTIRERREENESTNSCSREKLYRDRSDDSLYSDRDAKEFARNLENETGLEDSQVLTLGMIIAFWQVVFLFYVQFVLNRLLADAKSCATASKSTMSSRVFGIHSACTSTTKLYEIRSVGQVFHGEEFPMYVDSRDEPRASSSHDVSANPSNVIRIVHPSISAVSNVDLPFREWDTANFERSQRAVEERFDYSEMNTILNVVQYMLHEVESLTSPVGERGRNHMTDKQIRIPDTENVYADRKPVNKFEHQKSFYLLPDVSERLDETRNNLASSAKLSARKDSVTDDIVTREKRNLIAEYAASTNSRTKDVSKGSSEEINVTRRSCDSDGSIGQCNGLAKAEVRLLEEGPEESTGIETFNPVLDSLVKGNDEPGKSSERDEATSLRESRKSLSVHDSLGTTINDETSKVRKDRFSVEFVESDSFDSSYTKSNGKSENEHSFGERSAMEEFSDSTSAASNSLSEESNRS